jgi:protein-disulfide isomerase
VKHLVLAALLAATAIPATAQAEMSADQKTEIEALVKEYILNNGEVIIESVNKFQAKQEEESNKQADAAAKDLLAAIKADKTLPSAGNPDGDVVVVEFFDFNCGWCKKAYEEIQQLINEDKNVRVVLYDIPILGPSSTLSSRWALAAHAQGKYWDFHKALMKHEGQVDEAILEKIAKDTGLDVAKMKKDIEDPKIADTLKDHVEKAKSVGVQGTPGFLINEQIFRGYIPYNAMKEAIATARGGATKKN